VIPFLHVLLARQDGPLGLVQEIHSTVPEGGPLFLNLRGTILEDHLISSGERESRERKQRQQ